MSHLLSNGGKVSDWTFLRKFSRNGFIAGSRHSWPAADCSRLAFAFGQSNTVNMATVSGGSSFSWGGTVAVRLTTTEPARIAGTKTLRNQIRVLDTLRP